MNRYWNKIKLIVTDANTVERIFVLAKYAAHQNNTRNYREHIFILNYFFQIYLSAYMPTAAPPKWAAWSKNRHAKRQPAKSTPINTLIAYKIKKC